MSRAKACRVCSCTEARACPGGCSWVLGSQLPIGAICSVCEHRAWSTKLTRKPKESLVELFSRKSFDHASATTGMSNVRALINRGLMLNEYVPSKKRTVYWLTPLGREVARRAA